MSADGCPLHAEMDAYRPMSGRMLLQLDSPLTRSLIHATSPTVCVISGIPACTVAAPIGGVFGYDCRQVRAGRLCGISTPVGPQRKLWPAEQSLVDDVDASV